MPNLIRASARSLCVTLALAGLASACSTNDPSASPSTASAGGADSVVDPSSPVDASTLAPDVDSTAPATTAGTSDSSGGKPEPWRSPLDRFLGYGDDQRTADDVALDEANSRQVEQLITTCMSGQGFQYVPRDPSSKSIETGPWSLPPEEFARQYGYGITTIDKEAVAGDDPNQQIVDAMSVPERRAYYQALYGSVITVDDNGNIVKRAPASDTNVPDANTSCSAQASTEVYGDSGETTSDDAGNDPFVALEDEISALYDRVASDQRVVEATTAWASCMADDGFPGYTELTDPPTDVDSRAGEVMGDRRDPSTADPAALQELRTFEVGVATADFQCHIAFDDVQHAVQTEIEQQFIDEHRTELESYRDAIAAGTVGKG